MSDIIDELDRLQDTIEGFPKRSTIKELASALERRIEIVNEHWPALSARLREAERERDEWKLASSKNGDAMIGYQSRAIVAEQRLVEAERKANAFDEVAEGRIGIGRNGTNYRQWCAWRQGHGCPDGPTSVSANLLTAIQAALAAKETEQ